MLAIRNLTVRFERGYGVIRRRKSVVEAVSDISMEVGESETISIVGESGSGKTTLARCIVRLLNPSSGSISYDGSDVSHFKGKQLKRYHRDVQMIFQDPYESLNPRVQVFDAISTPIRLLTGERDKSKIRDSVLQLSEEVGLGSRFLERFPHELSGGERQRVNIAKALAPSPKVLVADEPITMLDSTQRLNILNLIRNMKTRRNLTVILITHDLASAKVLGGKTYVMYLGKLVEMGAISEVLPRPYHPYVELIRDSTPVLRRSPLAFANDRVEQLDPLHIEKIGQGCIFRPRCKYATQICSEKRPPLAEVTQNRYAACYHPLPERDRE